MKVLSSIAAQRHRLIPMFWSSLGCWLIACLLWGAWASYGQELGRRIEKKSETLSTQPLLDPQKQLGQQTFWDNQDWDWYRANIPFFECPDESLTTTYYYRWELMTKHVVYGSPEDGYAFTEFIDRPFWSGTYGAISCPAGHQIYEARWLRSPDYVQDYIRYWLKTPGAEPRKYSCWLADAAWAAHLVHPQGSRLKELYPDFRSNHQGWIDRHWVESEGLFWQTGHDDGMELNINSRQTADALRGAPGFRPTLNAYLWADARALAKMANLHGDEANAKSYLQQADRIKSNLQGRLWDPKRQFFMQRFQKTETHEGYTIQAGSLTHQTGKFAGDSHGRELIGYVPWQFGLPDAGYEAAWKYLMDPDYFAAPYGPTTVERHDPMFYLTNHCCFWSGQSWPYGTTQTLKGMANLLHDYRQEVVNRGDYLALLKTYAKSHTKNGRPYLAEACDPDTGSWEGHDNYQHSEHYFHSGFVDLIITGLIGFRPQEDDSLVVDPLAPASWDYFALDRVAYRGHDVSVAWDRLGNRYGHGKGWHIWVDGKLVHRSDQLEKVSIAHAFPTLEESNAKEKMPRPINLAVNNSLRRFPVASASSTLANSSPAAAIDGQAWYTLHPPNRWVADRGDRAGDGTEWYSVDFGTPRKIDRVAAAILDDGETSPVAAPMQVTLQAMIQGDWKTIETQSDAQPIGHRPYVMHFPELETTAIRLILRCRPGTTVGLSEVECWGDGSQGITAAPSDPLNLVRDEGPQRVTVRASFTSPWDRVEEVIDGKYSYRPSPRNRWTCYQSPNGEDWLEFEFPQMVSMQRAVLHLFDDRGGVQAPGSFSIEYWQDGWQPVRELSRNPLQPTGGEGNEIRFAKLETNKIRVLFQHRGNARSGVTEVEFYGDEKPKPTEVTASHPSDDKVDPQVWLRDAKRIVFLGDSITYAGEAQVFVELWMQSQFGDGEKTVINVGLPSETVSGLSEEGHAGGAFPRPVLEERLQRVLKATNPDLVIACYGMNCGIYLPLDEERFQKYRQGIESLHRQVSAVAKCIIVTPPTFDDQVAKKDFSYNSVLEQYSTWLLSQRKLGWCVLDLHHPMEAELARKRKDAPSFTLQPDAVHPNDDGYWVIAKCLLAELGETRAASWQTPGDFREALGIEEELARLVRKRMQLRRDAYLSAAGHLRPGLAKGKPLSDVESDDRELTSQIQDLRK